MKTIYVVQVDDARKPVFPNACVVCGRAGTGGLATMSLSDEHGRVEFMLYRFSKKPGQGSLLEVPVHEGCVLKLSDNFLKGLALAIGLAAVMIVAGFFTDHIVFSLFLVLLAVAYPFIYRQSMKIVPVEFDHYDHKYIVIFRGAEYAEAFARLNRAEAMKCKFPYQTKAGPV